MVAFRRFLESPVGKALSESPEFLPYYALPYVSNPTDHPSFKSIFQTRWVEDLRRRLEHFLRVVLESVDTPEIYRAFVALKSAGNSAGEDNDRVAAVQEEYGRREDNLKQAFYAREEKLKDFARSLYSLSEQVIDVLRQSQKTDDPISSEFVSFAEQRLATFKEIIVTGSGAPMGGGGGEGGGGSSDQGGPGAGQDADGEAVVGISDASKASTGVSGAAGAEMVEINMSKLKRDLGDLIKVVNAEDTYEADGQSISDDAHRTCSILQALRWRLITQPRRHGRREIVQNYVESDVLGCYSGDENGYVYFMRESKGPHCIASHRRARELDSSKRARPSTVLLPAHDMVRNRLTPPQTRLLRDPQRTRLVPEHLRRSVHVPPGQCAGSRVLWQSLLGTAPSSRTRTGRTAQGGARGYANATKRAWRPAKALSAPQTRAGDDQGGSHQVDLRHSQRALRPDRVWGRGWPRDAQRLLARARDRFADAPLPASRGQDFGRGRGGSPLGSGCFCLTRQSCVHAEHSSHRYTIPPPYHQVCEKLISSSNKHVRSCINGTLFSVLPRKVLKERAIDMSLPEFLDNLLLDETADPEDLEQYKFILGILREEGGDDGDDEEDNEEEKVGDDIEEDELEEDDEEEDFTSAKAVIEDEEETLPAGGDDELRGERLLASVYAGREGFSASTASPARLDGSMSRGGGDSGMQDARVDDAYAEEKMDSSLVKDKGAETAAAGAAAVGESKVGFLTRVRIALHRIASHRIARELDNGRCTRPSLCSSPRTKGLCALTLPSYTHAPAHAHARAHTQST